MRFLVFALLAFFAQNAYAQSYITGLKQAPSDKYAAIPNAYAPLLNGALPPSHDLSPNMPPPGKQMNESCVGWAVAYALKTYQERIERNWQIVNPSGFKNYDHIFSPAFIYNQINGGIDKGANFGDAFRILATQGAAPWSSMPYKGQPFEPVPTAAIAAASDFKIDTFRTINFKNINEVKTQLVAGFPVVIGTKVFPQLANLAPNAIWSYISGPWMGNHAMVVVGYDDNKQAFKFINSWGEDWSSGGYGWVSYNMFPTVINEAYIVVDLKGLETEKSVTSDVWTPPSIENDTSNIKITKIDLNYFEPTLGYPVGIRVEGELTVKEGLAGTARIVIPLERQEGGSVGSLSVSYRLPSGQAAFGTPPLPLNGNGVKNLKWFAFVPYCALNLPKTKLCLPMPIPYAPPATSNLKATPILFVDNFGVATGEEIKFFVNL